tara:strand:+ start:953 stop:1300 length:348 start_codon:yes stop_codon:yes gene_type:complete
MVEETIAPDYDIPGGDTYEKTFKDEDYKPLAFYDPRKNRYNYTISTLTLIGVIIVVYLAIYGFPTKEIKDMLSLTKDFGVDAAYEKGLKGVKKKYGPDEKRASKSKGKKSKKKKK